MVHLAQVAKFVDDEIIGQFLRQENDPVRKIQILPGRTAPPAALLVANANAVVGKIVKSIKMLEPTPHQSLRRSFIFQIMRPGSPRPFANFFSLLSYLVGQPTLFAVQKFQSCLLGDPPRNRQNRGRIGTNAQTDIFRSPALLYFTIYIHVLTYNPNATNYILILRTKQK